MVFIIMTMKNKWVYKRFIKSNVLIIFIDVKNRSNKTHSQKWVKERCDL